MLNQLLTLSSVHGPGANPTQGGKRLEPGYSLSPQSLTCHALESNDGRTALHQDSLEVRIRSSPA